MGDDGRDRSRDVGRERLIGIVAVTTGIDTGPGVDPLDVDIDP